MSKIIGLFFLLFLFGRCGFCQSNNSQIAKTIIWSPSALSFANYAVVDNVDSLPYNPYLANTNLNITYYYKLSKQDSLIIYIENLFIRKGSWVKLEHIADKALLKHEQGHFNISEIYARKLGIAFSNYHFTANYKLEIKQVATTILDEQNKQQVSYDKETNYGESKLIQKNWNETIQNKLNTLKPINKKQIALKIEN